MNQYFALGTNPAFNDTDGDGMPDKWEIDQGLNPRVNDANDDLDRDGVTNLVEFQNNLDPTRADSRSDGTSDVERVYGAFSIQYQYDRTDRLIGADYGNGFSISYEYDGNGNIIGQSYLSRPDATNSLPALWRLANGLTATNAATADGAYDDPDGDGWTNLQEWKDGTNPRDSNSKPSSLVGAGEGIATFELPFTPTNFVMAVGQLNGLGAEEIVVGGDGNPGNMTNFVFILTQEAIGWSKQRVDIGPFGITSIAIGQPTNRESAGIYVGFRQAGGRGGVFELRNVGGTWQTNALAFSTNETAFVLGVRPGGYVFATLSPSDGPPGALYALFPSNNTAVTTLLSTNASRNDTLGTLFHLNPDAQNNLVSQLLDNSAARLLDGTNIIQLLETTNLIEISEATNLLTQAYLTNVITLDPGADRVPSGALLRLENKTWYFGTPCMSWPDAQAHARGWGGNLATIRNASESSWVRANIGVSCPLDRSTGDPRSFWIGLSRPDCNSGFSWSSGEPVGYTAWGVFQPQCGSGADVYTALGQNGDWYVLPYFWSRPQNITNMQTGVVEVKLRAIEISARVPEPASAKRPLWKGITLESGSPRREFTNSTSLFYAYLDDKNLSGRVDAEDEFVFAEYALPGPANQQPLLQRQILAGTTLSSSYALACSSWVPLRSQVLFTGEPDGRVFSWIATNSTSPLQRQLFSSAHVGKAWHALSSVKLAEPGEGLVGLLVDPTNQSACDVILWPPQPGFNAPPDIPETAPIARILPEPDSGTNLVRIAVRLWDAEGNSSLPELQYFNPISSNWVNAAILSIDGRTVTYIAATPTGSDHEVLWNAKDGLNLTPGVTINVQLRVRASDSTHSGNYIGEWSEPMSFTLVVPRDSDSDGIPDDWEVERFGTLAHRGDEDTDGDGFTNLQEYIADTDPNNPASALRITAIREIENNVELDFDSISGITYRVENKDFLSDATWTQIDAFTGNVTGTQTVIDTGAGMAPSQFYRIKGGPSGEVVSERAGYYGITLNAGPNAISVPLHNFPTARGLVDTVSGSTVTVSGNPGWTANAFAPKDGFSQYIVLLRKDASESPGNEGDWWTIAGNTGNTLTLNPGTDVLSSLLSSGDQIEVRRLTSMKDLFGTGPTLILNKDSDGNAASGSFANADVIRFISGTSFGQPIFYHDGTILAEGYYVEGGSVGPLDGSTITVLPGQGFMVFRKSGSSATTVLVNGQVQVSRLTQYLKVGPNVIGSPFAGPAPIGTSGLLESGWVSDSDGSAAGGSFATADLFRPITVTSFGPSVFHHDGTLLPAGWYANSELNNNYPLQPGKAYIFFITAGHTVRWRQAVPYAP